MATPGNAWEQGFLDGTEGCQSFVDNPFDVADKRWEFWEAGRREGEAMSDCFE